MVPLAAGYLPDTSGAGILSRLKVMECTGGAAARCIYRGRFLHNTNEEIPVFQVTHR